MRELPVTVALSLLVHAAALTWYAAMDHPQRTRAVTQPVAKVEVALPVEDPPVEVALLDDDTVNQFLDQAPTQVAVSTRPSATQSAREKTAMATTTRTTTELPPATTDSPPSSEKKKSMLSMRDGRPEPTIHRPGSDGISDAQLRNMVDGEIEVKISNLPGAQANADFEKAQARLHNQNWVTNATGEQITEARFAREAARQAKKEVELVAQKDGTHTTDKKTFTAKVNRDGTVDIDDKDNLQVKSLIYAEFDVTDAFMRLYGQDPYAAEKRKYLDRTRDQRVEIGKRYRTEQLAQSARLMANNLARLWATTSDPTKRKAELLALWDECAETGDEEIVAGGAEARRLVIGWVHAKRVAFTPAELAAFNARKQSKATFAP